MGRINIRGGSPLKMEFLKVVGGPTAKTTKVDLVKRGPRYTMLLPFKTATGNGANMTGTTRSERKIQVDFDQ